MQKKLINKWCRPVEEIRVLIWGAQAYNFRQEDRHNKLSLGSGRQLANLKDKLLLKNIADVKGY